MVSDWSCLTYFCVFHRTVIRRTESFWTPCICGLISKAFRSQITKSSMADQWIWVWNIGAGIPLYSSSPATEPRCIMVQHVSQSVSARYGTGHTRWQCLHIGCPKSKCTYLLFNCLWGALEITSYPLQSVTHWKLHSGSKFLPLITAVPEAKFRNGQFTHTMPFPLPCLSEKALDCVFPIDWHSAAVFESHIPCRSPAMPFWKCFTLCLSHLIYIARPCFIHTCHAVPMPFACRSPVMPLMCLSVNYLSRPWQGDGMLTACLRLASL
jgi:hypothetical protein